MTDADVIVVGGGPAGSAAAIALARAGRRVLLLEREAGPVHKVCGEFLSGEAADALRALGVDLGALGALPLATVGLADDRRSADAPLPFPAFAVSRLTLDAALLDRARRAGAAVRTGVAVRAIEPAGAGVRVRTADGTVVQAPRVLLATGKHDLRDWRRTAPAPRFADTVGWKMHLRLAPDAAAAVAGRTELHLLRDGGYAGLQPAGEGAADLCAANLCVLVPASGGRTFADVLAGLAAGRSPLARRLLGARPAWPRALAVAGTPYGHLAPVAAPAVWRLGDQAAVTPSLTGDGMAIALHSGRVAAAVLLAGGGADGYDRALRALVRPQLSRALLAQRVLETAAGRRSVLAIAAVWPGLLSAAASATRLEVGQCA